MLQTKIIKNTLLIAIVSGAYMLTPYISLAAISITNHTPLFCGPVSVFILGWLIYWPVLLGLVHFEHFMYVAVLTALGTLGFLGVFGYFVDKKIATKWRIAFLLPAVYVGAIIATYLFVHFHIDQTCI